MPWLKANAHRYGPNWPVLKAAVLARAQGRCEGSPRFADCRAANGRPHPVTGSRVVLTIAHLDRVQEHLSLENLRALCQRCHLTHDRVDAKRENRQP